MGAQYFNFATKFPDLLGLFLSLNLVLLEENFLTTRKYSNRLKFMGRGQLPPAMTPLVRKILILFKYY